MTMQRTASQTVGPFFLEALIHAGDEVLAKPGTAGAKIVVEGKVLDADGVMVNDAVLEIFQVDASGQYVSDGAASKSGARFTGFGRATIDGSGLFRFTTVYPGALHSAAGVEAPHLDVMVFARGLLKPLVTRIYFEGDAANAKDPVLAQVPANRRHTLQARRGADNGSGTWHFDVHLQGKDETVFFDF
jgi:protocatechuate 3,4-dioxygenase alpha subunit